MRSDKVMHTIESNDCCHYFQIFIFESKRERNNYHNRVLNKSGDFNLTSRTVGELRSFNKPFKPYVRRMIDNQI